MNENFTNKDLINALLLSFGISYYDFQEVQGATVTLYKFRPKIGVRVAKIRNLKDEFASALGVPSVRIIAPMSDGSIGIEVPNKQREIIRASDIFSSQNYQNTNMQLPCAIGRTVTNDVFMTDLADMPHLLVAGATGQGKSVCLNVMLMSLLQKKTPAELKLVLIDPKKVELSAYSAISKPYIARMEGIPPIITEAAHANIMLDALCRLMEKRYSILSGNGCRNIMEYNHISLDINKMEYYVVVIDEYGDLMMDRQYGRSLEYFICRLAQKARAVGIHLIIATQRPDTKVVTGNIKANFPTRIAFRTTTGIDSRVVIDQTGAEKLSGRGDMIFFNGNGTQRMQCAYISTEEVNNNLSTISERNNGCRQKVIRVQSQMHDDDFRNHPIFKSLLDENGICKLYRH